MFTPVKYIGSKYLLSSQIIQSIPPHKVYVEVFGGSAAVLFRKPPSPIEVYNDVDNHIVSLFRVIRDTPEALKAKLDLTLFSREECRAAFEKIRTGQFTDDIDHAWAVFVAFNQSVAGVVTYKRGGWSYGVVRNNTLDYTNRIDSIFAMRDRLRNVYIENLDYADIFKKYDNEDTFFYIDPPYVPETRVDAHYLSEFSRADHIRLIRAVNELRGRWILSGYDDPIYNDLTSGNKEVYPMKSKSRTDSVVVSRNEVLWYSPGCNIQLTLAL